jgi:signal transduction histidine kinase
VIGDVVFDSWPRLLLVSAGGAVLILLAPWAVRGVLLLERLLVWTLLGQDPAAQRIADLERSRAHAVDDAAVMLRRIERDLHDGVQARLVALGMNLTMIGEALGADATDTTRALLAAARDNAKAAVTELREVVRGIHPPVLDRGLDAAIATLAARNPIPVLVHTDIPERPSAAIETIAYFCLAELLTNITKHSGAVRASIEIIECDGRLRLQVKDNGRGGVRPDYGTGLRGLADRVSTVDGTMDTRSPLGGPTVVTIDLPLHT